MKLQNTSRGTVFDVYVKLNAKQFQVKIEDDRIIVYCRETPVKGRVNKEFSKLFKRRAKIISGFRSRRKKLFIMDVDIKEAYASIYSAQNSARAVSL